MCYCLKILSTYFFTRQKGPLKRLNVKLKEGGGCTHSTERQCTYEVTNYVITRLPISINCVSSKKIRKVVYGYCQQQTQITWRNHEYVRLVVTLPILLLLRDVAQSRPRSSYATVVGIWVESADMSFLTLHQNTLDEGDQTMKETNNSLTNDNCSKMNV